MNQEKITEEALGGEYAKIHFKLADNVHDGINSEQDGTTELAAIKDSQQVKDLVKMVLEAPVDQGRRDHTGCRYFIAFHMKDNFTVIRPYWLESGELSRGIMLPKEFAQAVKGAVGN